MRNLVLTAASVMALAAATTASANVLVNGDFEVGSGTTVPGWVVQDYTPGSVLLLQGSDYSACCNVVGAGSSAAALANHFISFGAGQVANNGRIFQDFVVAPGTYTLQFDFGAIQGTQTMAFGIYDYGISSFLLINSVQSTGGQNLDALFHSYSFQFTTTTGNLDIQFDNYLSATENTDAFVDNVSINPVPEPATWAMMIGGFALAGAAMRRRKAVVGFA